MAFLNCFIYFFLLGTAVFILGRILAHFPISYRRFPFRCYPFEQGGRLYLKIGIRKWQNRLPDMSRILVGLIPRKALTNENRRDLPRMIRETCVAELIHVLLIPCGFAAMWIMPGIWGTVIAVVYALSNIPFILIQRYNRPRLIRLMERTVREKAPASP